MVVPARQAGNRFLGFLKVSKYVLMGGIYLLHAEDETKDRLCNWDLLIKWSSSMPFSRWRVTMARNCIRSMLIIEIILPLIDAMDQKSN
jgi:hypothetical protein